jgi:hypothetical protein
MTQSNRFADLRWGARWGGLFGLIFMLFAMGVLAMKGASENSASAHVNVLLLLAAYPLTGLLSGLIVGLFRSALKRRRGAMVVGMVAALPTSLVFLRLIYGAFSAWGGVGLDSRNPWSRLDWRSGGLHLVGADVRTHLRDVGRSGASTSKGPFSAETAAGMMSEEHNPEETVARRNFSRFGILAWGGPHSRCHNGSQSLGANRGTGRFPLAPVPRLAADRAAAGRAGRWMAVGSAHVAGVQTLEPAGAVRGQVERPGGVVDGDATRAAPLPLGPGPRPAPKFSTRE